MWTPIFPNINVLDPGIVLDFLLGDFIRTLENASIQCDQLWRLHCWGPHFYSVGGISCSARGISGTMEWPPGGQELIIHTCHLEDDWQIFLVTSQRQCETWQNYNIVAGDLEQYGTMEWNGTVLYRWPTRLIQNVKVLDQRLLTGICCSSIYFLD